MIDLNPFLVSHDHPYHRLAHAELGGDSLLGDAPAAPNTPNLSNGFPSEFTAPFITLAFWLITAALFHLVVRIIFVGPEPQMRRIAARRVVAGVADNEAIRDGADAKSMGYAMGFVYFPAESEKAISLVVATTTPFPAPLRMRRFINFLPKVGELARGKSWIEMRARAGITGFSGGHSINMALVRAFEPLDRLLRSFCFTPTQAI